MEKEIYFHLGLVRTGTSFLQKELFPKMKLDFYDKPSYNELLSLPFDSEKTLLSMETWSHNMYTYNKPEYLDFDFIFLERLKKIFPNAKIILCTRKEGYVKSLYYLHVLHGWTIPFKKFKERINEGYLNQERYVKKINELFPDSFIYTYEEFKKDNKKIVEKICDFTVVEKVVLEKGKKRVNASLSPTKIEVLRLFNYTSYYKINALNKFFKIYIRRWME